MRHIKLYDTWKQVKGVFKKPRLIFKWGNWYKSSGLPVWRRGRYINMTKHFYSNCEKVKVKKLRPALKLHNINIPEGYVDGYEWVWKEGYKKAHPIYTKLFKPTYQLPKWFTFYIFNIDLVWKTKWSDYRFEFSPQFTIVFFKWHLSWFLAPPKDCRVDSYWESILWYIDKRNLEKTFKNTSHWTNMHTNETEFGLTPDMVEDEYKEVVQTLIDEYKENHKNDKHEDSSIW